MAQISINNGNTFESAPVSDELWAKIESLGLDIVAHYMDDEVMAQVPIITDATTERQFLDAYLTLAPHDLVIG